MPQSIIAKTGSGTLVISDQQSRNTDCESSHESLYDRACDEGFFIIDTEDEAELRIELVCDGHTPPSIVQSYEAIGGTFRLNLPSGSLWIWDPGNRATGYPLSIPAGTYCLSAKRLNTQDLSNYTEHVKAAMGEEDWKHHERIGKIELTGCGLIVLGILLTIIPFTRPYWWIYAPVILAPYLIAWLLKSSRRYKRTERARTDFENRQPHLILFLSLDNSLSKSVRGGTITFN